jgi:PAS domain S-box-containing protein
MTASPARWSPVEVASFINEYYEAWSGTDEDHIMSFYADDVVLQIPSVIMQGKAALRHQYVHPFITAFPGNRHRVKHMICGQGVVNVEFSFEAKHTGPFKGHAATGARVMVPGCGVYEFDSERRQVTAARIYLDVGTSLQSIAAVPANDPSKAAEALLLNERNLSLMVNTIPTTAWTTRPDGYCDFLNRRWLDYAGMTAEQAAGWGWAEAIHPDDRPRLVDYWESCLASGVPVETEGRMRRFDGSYRWFLFRANPLRDDSGNIVKWYGTNIDIDDRKRGEEALRASEVSWRQIVDHIPALVSTWGAMGEVEFVNRQTLEYFGRTREELQNWALIDAVHPDDLPRVIEARKKSLEAGQVYDSVHRCRRADGMYRWFQVRGLPVRDARGPITAWYVVLTDIDDRKKAEEALQASERNLNQIINAIPTVVGVMRADGTPLYGNQGVTDYLGLTLEDLQRGDFRARIYHPEDLARLRESRRVAFTRPVPFENEIRVLGKDGNYRAFLFRYKPLLDEAGTIDRWFMAALDIEDRKRAEDAQARQVGVRADVSAAFSKPTHLGEILRGCTEAIVRRLDAAFARIWTLSKDETVLELQASAGIYTRLDGSYSRIPVGDLKVGLIAREKKAHFTNDVMNDPRVNDKGWARQNGMVAFAGYPLVVEDRLIGVLALFARRPLAGSVLDTLASVADTIAQGIERKRAEEALTRARAELTHMARVTTLSALTASIAHDVNQPIAAAVTSAGACLRWLNRDEPDVQRAREAALRIEEDGKRAAAIITHVKSLYKKDASPQREPVSVNHLVSEMLMLLRSEAERHSVVMRTELAADLPSVSADRVQLQQVLMNLMLNGMEAMSAQPGALTISTRRQEGAVLVSVSDTGVGIPADQLDDIFNAFVTTKAGGTGMGLAISRTIIDAHGGRLWATANPASGAAFHFSLPSHPMRQ